MGSMQRADALGEGRTDSTRLASIHANALAQRAERIGRIAQREVVPALDRGTSVLNAAVVDGMVPDLLCEFVESCAELAGSWRANEKRADDREAEPRDGIAAGGEGLLMHGGPGFEARRCDVRPRRGTVGACEPVRLRRSLRAAAIT